MRQDFLPMLPFILVAGLCVPSCQMLHGVGNDLNNFGKSLAVPKRNGAVAPSPIQRKSAAPSPKAHKTRASEAPAVAAPVRPKENQRSVAPVKQLDRLQPELSKEGMFSTRENPEPISLEDLSTKTDIQEVPQRQEPWSGGTAVDINGDGIPDVRYRQREQ